MIEIGANLINKNNINYVYNRITDTNGYIYKRTYHIYIVFNGNKSLELETYDHEEFRKWWEMLK